MIPFWALILLAGSAVVAVLLMLTARRYGPKDGLLADAVPAAAVSECSASRSRCCWRS